MSQEPISKEFELGLYDKVTIRKNMGIEITVLQNPRGDSKEVKVYISLNEAIRLKKILNQELEDELKTEV